jgi:predicted DNA-binding transcriptional regulator YafY
MPLPGETLDDEDDDDDDEDQVATGEAGPERVAKSERIMNLIAVLLRADGPLPVTEILGKVTGYDDKASRDSLMRRFERDKKVLRDMGIPVEHALAGPFGVDGYTIPRDAFFLDEVRLPPASGQLLRGLFAWAHAGGGELSNDLRTALVKLGYFVEDDGTKPERAREALAAPRAPSGNGRETVDPKLAPPALISKNLEALSEAVMRHKRVKIRYFTYTREEETTREVDAWGLGFAGQAWNKGAWYLVGHCHLRKDVRCFKVSRIRGEVQVLNGSKEAPDFAVPQGFRVREHIGKARFEYQDIQAAFGDRAEKLFTARVRFDAPVAAEVRSHVPHARLVARDDKKETLEFAVHARRSFLRFLLRYVPRLEIVSPPGLDGELRDLAREVIAIYGGADR